MRMKVLGEKLRAKNENERSEERELRFGMKLLNLQEYGSKTESAL